MLLSLIVARARNGTIGHAGALPWHLPADMAHFRRVTLGKPVIMGRRTWESLPDRFRPLPQRRNIVISRQVGWHAEGAEWAADLDAALKLVHAAPEAVVIGGEMLYRSALPRVDRAYVTEIERDFDGDTCFPALDPAEWRAVAVERGLAPAPLDCPVAWITYERRHAVSAAQAPAATSHAAEADV